jgi:hypothetical protein
VRYVLLVLATAAIALTIGFGLSWYALTSGRFLGAVEVGPWSAWPDVGSPNPNPYTRSHLAREASLQLGSAEGLQFTATLDSDGDPLTRACSYSVSGRTPLASFWTLVAVDSGGRNIAAPDVEPAIRSNGIVRENDGTLVVHVGTRLKPGNWLEIRGSGPFSLVLTLYDTAAFSGFSSDESMPAILKEECR